MHTMTIIHDGRDYYVNHNGDWSGDAYVRWTTPDGVEHEVVVPGAVLAACGRNATLTDAIGALESLYVRDV